MGHSLKYPFDTSATPFEPDLDAAPNDFGIAITYPTSLNTHVGSAESVAVDGNGNIWITNRYNPGLGGNSAAPGASTLIELNTAGVAISPSTNYTYGGILDDPLNLAIDPSGDIWVTNYGGSKIVEVIGAAAPVVTPLSTAANAGTLGKLP